MRSLRLLSGVLVLLYGAVAQAQTPTAGVTAPAFVRLDGDLRTATGEARTGNVVLVVSLYASQTDSAPVWSEEQTIALDATGHYAIFAGATQPDGLPRQFFAADGGAQWIGVAVAGEQEQPRVRILSVPYALSAGNADTLGGASLKDFVMSENLAESVKAALDGDGTAIGSADGKGSDPGALGIPNRVAKYGGAGLPDANSIIFDNGTVVGVNNDLATSKLDVAGVIRSTSLANVPTNGAGMEIAFTAGVGVIQAYDRTAASYRSILLDGSFLGLNAASLGKTGVGLNNPSAMFDVNGVIRTQSAVNFPTAGAGIEMAFAGGTTGIIQAYDRGAAAYRALNVDASLLLMNVASAGSVGIGAVPAGGDKLRVAGNVVVDGNIGAKYQDVAEWVETDEVLEPGTVVIVDPNAANRVVPSPSAYDTCVWRRLAPARLISRARRRQQELAQSGRVVIKVDATYGAIKPGDLLVTSPTPGYAMLSKPIKVGKQLMHRPGTLVGKALEALPTGKGEILVLLTLQ